MGEVGPGLRSFGPTSRPVDQQLAAQYILLRLSNLRLTPGAGPGNAAGNKGRERIIVSAIQIQVYVHFAPRGKAHAINRRALLSN